MATVKGGVSLALMETGVGAAVPAHFTPKPCPYGTLGHYSFSGATGAIAAAMSADGELFHFRWTNTTSVAVVSQIFVTGMRATTAFAVGAIDLKATVARSWTVVGSGGTALTLTTNNQKLRTSTMGASLVGDARIATTAALGAGTKTLDVQDIGSIAAHSSGGVGSATPIIGAIYLPTMELFRARVEAGEHPLVLATNEGFVVRGTVPGTGVWNLGIGLHWAEVSLY